MQNNSIKTILEKWKKAWPCSTFKKSKKNAPINFTENKDLFLVGTEFQQKVWKELLTIPKGKTISYKEIAKRIKKPKAIRAVGTALGKNPIPMILPCHRVIASDGSLGGFAGGLNLKKKLLNAEHETN